MDLEIINIASDTNNNKNIRNFTHQSKLRNSLCGDEIQIKLVIRNDKIVDFGYQEHSCVYCQAAVSLLSKISINSKKNEINQLCDNAKFFFDNKNLIDKKKWFLLKKIFKKKNLFRKECILLPFKILKRIVSN